MMRHGRRSRSTLLNLGVRRLVGAEPEVDKSYTQTASERSNNCLMTSKFDLSKAALRELTHISHYSFTTFITASLPSAVLARRMYSPAGKPPMSM